MNLKEWLILIGGFCLIFLAVYLIPEQKPQINQNEVVIDDKTVICLETAKGGLWCTFKGE